MEEPQGGRPPAPYLAINGAGAQHERRMRTLTHVLYTLYALHWFTGGLSALIAVIVGYLKRSDAADTPYAAHFEWQIRTFWIGAIGYLIGGVLVAVVIGFAVIAAVSIWAIYRIIKGWLFLYENKSLEPRARF